MSEQTPKIDVSIHDKENPERIFRGYMENLKLSPEDFNKKILDVGSGAGHFAKWAKEHGLSSNIFSVDKHNADSGTPNVVRGESDKLPFKDESFDLVISNNSMPMLLYFSEIPQKAIKEMLSEMLRVVKANGEIRLAPVAEWKKTESLRDSFKSFNDEMEALKKEQGVEIEQISLGKSKYSEGELEEFLYKIKKLR
ncbi:MAG: class I SAM-dependent methyltransferase [bacterium]|nr:class I SAM-dependent methyltransferase [bacterium]